MVPALWSVVLLLLSASPAFADLKVPASVFMMAQAADVHSTYRARASGNGIEGNPLMDVTTGQQVAIKAATTVGVVWLTTHLERRGHPRLAKVTLYSLSAVTAGIAAHNYRIARR